MARKAGQSNRPRKRTKPNRTQKPAATAVASPQAAPPSGVENAVPANGAGAPISAAPPAAAPVRARSSRASRPYQHGKQATTTRMSTKASAAISRAQEYAFIREDLRRLLITAGVLIAVMLALLFLIDR